MLGCVSHMGIKVDQEPRSQSTVGTAAPAVAAVPPLIAQSASKAGKGFGELSPPRLGAAHFLDG
jgi:hypothetical protein